MRFVIPALALSLAAVPAIAQTSSTTPAPAAPAVSAPAPAMSAPATPPTRAQAALAKRFETANTTHDGHLTKSQAQAAHMAMVVRHFAAIDKDHKGYVTLDDLSAYQATQRAARGQTSKPPG